MLLPAAPDRRRPPSDTAAFALISAAAFCVLLALSSGMTFWSDEWAFIARRALADPASWFEPHNEHFVLLPVIVYRLLVETVGLTTYVPFVVVLLGLHIAVCGLVFRIARRRVGWRVAFAFGTIALFFGAGFENLYWAFQIGFVGSMVGGLAALDLMDGAPSSRRITLIAAALAASVASQAVGLIFVGAVGIELLLTPGWRSFWKALLVPIAVFAAWFILVGHEGVGAYQDPLALLSLARPPEYVAPGLGEAFGAITGVGPDLGIGVAGAVLAFVAWRWRTGRRPSARFAGLILAIAAEYVLIAINRSQLVPDQYNYSRYTYLSGILAMIAATCVLEPELAGIRRLSGSRRRLFLVGAVLVFELAALWNGRLLLDGRDLFLERASFTRALVSVALSPTLPTGVDATQPVLYVPIPSIDETRRIVAEYGSPISDVLEPWAVPAVTTAQRSDALRRLATGRPDVGGIAG